MSELLQILKNIVGEEYATEAKTTRMTYALTQSPNLFFYPNKIPDFVVYPRTPEQVSSIVRVANRMKIPITPRGSGTSSHAGNLALEGGILIDLRHMDKILEINEDNMVVVAEAGCSSYKITYECHKKGLNCVLGPEWQAAPQIGANVSTNATGHNMGRTGRLGDMIVGLEVVIPTGEIITLGSGAYQWGSHYHRYTGGPDLMGLFVNSGGTMGVITKVAIRLLNKPKLTYFTFGWRRDQMKEVAKAHYELQRYAEAYSIFLINSNTAKGFESFDIKPRIKIPEDVHFVMGIVQASQTDGEIGAKSEQIKQICDNNAGKDLGDMWEKVGGPPVYGWFNQFYGTMYGGSIKPSDGGDIGINSSCTLFYCPTMMFPEVYTLGYKLYVEKYHFPASKYLWYGWSDRNCMDPYPMFFFNGSDQEEIDRFAQFWREYHLELAKMGAVSYLVGIGHPKEMSYWLGPAYELTKKIKCLLDPNNIMNPGVL